MSVKAMELGVNQISPNFVDSVVEIPPARFSQAVPQIPLHHRDTWRSQDSAAQRIIRHQSHLYSSSPEIITGGGRERSYRKPGGSTTRLRSRSHRRGVELDAHPEWAPYLVESAVAGGIDELDFVDVAKSKVLGQISIGLRSNVDCTTIWVCEDMAGFEDRCGAISESDTVEFECTQFIEDTFTASGSEPGLSCACPRTCYDMYRSTGKYWSEHYVPPAACLDTGVDFDDGSDDASHQPQSIDAQEFMPVVDFEALVPEAIEHVQTLMKSDKADEYIYEANLFLDDRSKSMQLRRDLNGHGVERDHKNATEVLSGAAHMREQGKSPSGAISSRVFLLGLFATFIL